MGRAIDKKTAGLIILALNVFTILFNALIVLQLIPYQTIGGGRLASYQAACVSALIGFLVLGFQSLIVAIACGFIRFYGFKIFIKIVLWCFFAFTCFNVLTNLLGQTWFERIGFGLICIVQSVLLFRLAADKVPQTK